MELNELYELYVDSSGICIDTRKITSDCLFFALKGDNFNANEFAGEALNKGARHVVIDDATYQQDGTILVDDALHTLQQLANYHRKQLNIPVIGITGTNGKTTSKELINAVLSQHYHTTCTQGNLNNHIGVPLTLLSIQQDCEIAIIEMGANHIGEIDFLCRIAEPEYGIITNIGTAHIEGFGSKEGVIRTKNEMYAFIREHGKLVFTNGDDELLKELSSSIPKYTYGKSNADCMATLLTETPTIQLAWNTNTINATLYGSYNFYNILLAICVGQYFNVPQEKIIRGIETYVSSNNRSQLVITDKYQIYLDAYNANPSSMKVAIESFATNPSPNKIMILGDMLELGVVSRQEHQHIVDKAKELRLNACFVGNEFAQLERKHEFQYFKNAQELIDHLQQHELPDAAILIKGSRGIRLEQVAEYIKKKGQ